MKWFSKPPPPRRRHQDPQTEIRLQQIESLRDSVQRQGALITVYRDEIERLHQSARNTFDPSRANAHWARADQLHVKIQELETAGNLTYDTIHQLMDGLTDEDLSFLGGEL